MITAGEILKEKREKLGKSIADVSLDTKIQKRFLVSIEKNSFSSFDSEVFLTGFIKIYAQYLGLDTNKVLAVYRRSNPKQKQRLRKEPSPTPLKRNFKIDLFLLTPRLLATILITIFSLGILGYIGFQIYKFQSPPSLKITSPQNDQITNEEKITVEGETEENTEIEINGVLLNTTGSYFSKEISLQEGSNLITVKARKNNNGKLETVEVVKVIYQKVEEEEEDIPVKENRVSLEIVDSPAWIKLDIDDENKLSQVVEPSKVEYIFQNKFHIITGRLSSTKLYWNGNLQEWKNSKTAGVSELTCEIVELTLICN